jgi:hypothetical protein
VHLGLGFDFRFVLALELPPFGSELLFGLEFEDLVVGFLAFVVPALVLVFEGLAFDLLDFGLEFEVLALVQVPPVVVVAPAPVPLLIGTMDYAHKMSGRKD